MISRVLRNDYATLTLVFTPFVLAPETFTRRTEDSLKLRHLVCRVASNTIRFIGLREVTLRSSEMGSLFYNPFVYVIAYVQ